MAKLQLTQGTTSKTIKVFAQSSTTGLAAPSLAYNTSGLTCYYLIEGAAASVQVNLVTATLGTWTSSGFIVADGTNMIGLYEFGIPNLALASGKSVVIMFQGTGIVIAPIEIELTQTNNQDGVHGGMSAIPNTACTTNGSLITSGTGTAQLTTTNGDVTFSNTSIATVTTVGTLTTYTGNTPQTGDSFARIGATGSGLTSLATPTNITAGTITTTTNLTNAPTAGDFTAAMKTSLNAATPTAAAVTGNVGGSVASVTAAVTLPTIPANWITAAGIAAGALNGKGDWLLSSGYTAPNNSGIASIVSKLPTNNIADETLVIAGTNAILSLIGTNGSGLTQVQLSSTGLDSIVIETGIVASANLVNDVGTQLTSLNLPQIAALIAAMAAGQTAGAATGASTVTFAQTGIPTGKTRVKANVDTNGNRTNIQIIVPNI